MDSVIKIENKQNQRRENWTAVVFSLVSSFVLLFICSRSSFLYPCNDWNDANSYFSVGKALFNGLVPYRDVFDQKGMYLYFFYGLAYLISHTTFAGVFLLEIAAMTVFLYGGYKIGRLYTKPALALSATAVWAQLPWRVRAFIGEEVQKSFACRF